VQRHELQVIRGYLDLNYYTLLADEFAASRQRLEKLIN
jgi:hypothetical protein